MSGWPKISDIARDVRGGGVSARAMVDKALANIARHDKHRAIIALTDERAYERAKHIDTLVADGKPVGRLAGVPFIAKDNILAFGADTTAASNILKGFVAPYQATVIERLESEGAICVAKANLDAFGHGGSTENSNFFVTTNPHDANRVSGGSSGGSAAAVVLDMAPFSIATDTGGSIRQPASFCGAVGYKPTYGLVSRSGVIAMASSADTVGPITRTVEDAALILDIISGRDSLDSTTVARDEESYTKLDDSLKGKKIGVVKEFMAAGLDSGVKLAIEKALDKLRQGGAEIDEISVPSVELALACYYIICPAEISSNLSRYDGQRFGYSDQSATSLDESYEASRSKGFGVEAKRRIIIGTYVLSSGYYDAYYKKAQAVRTKIIEDFKQRFRSVDFLVGPTTPSTAFIVGQNNDPLSMYLSDVMTVAPSLAGLPAISVPAGHANGLPVGMQLIAPQRHDRSLLSVANEVERLIS